MAEEKSKPWYKSKGKWGAIILALFGVVQPISTAMGHPIQVPLWLVELVAGFTGYGIRDAIKK